MIRIIIADDDPLVSASLKIILESDPEIKVLGTGENGNAAIRLYSEIRPDIALLDIQMPEKNGIDAAKEILRLDPQAKILFLSTFSDNNYIAEALGIGSKGYILKQDYESVSASLKAVMRGQSVFGNEIASKLPDMLHKDKAVNYRDLGISEKEEEIIDLVALGLNNKEIAEKTFLSAGTVRNYLSVILEKLELRDRTQLAAFHYRNK